MHLGTRVIALLGLAAVAVAAAAARVDTAEAAFAGKNGRIAFARYGDVYTVNPDGSGQRRLVSHAADPEWSPDGTKLAFMRPYPSGRGDIFTINADGTGERQLTTGSRRSDPAWSPDGTKLAFSYYSADTGFLDSGPDYDIRVISAISGGEVNRPANSSDDEMYPSWSPDGSKIAYARTSAPTVFHNDTRFFTTNADGSAKEALTGFFHCAWGAPAWSPDGTKMALSWVYSENSTNGPGFEFNPCRFSADIRVRNADGSRWYLTAGDDPDWSPDGGQIAFERSGTIRLATVVGAVGTYVTSGSDPDWQSCHGPDPFPCLTRPPRS